MRYFGYESNLNRKDMQDREYYVDLSDPEPYMLEGWKIGFTNRTESRGGGVANITKQEGTHCWGVSFKIDEQGM